MARFFISRFCDVFFSHGKRLLIIAWLAGLFSGLSVYLSEERPLLLMPGIFENTLSIVILLLGHLLPLLFSVFAVYIGQPWVLLAICYVRALFFSLVSMYIFQIYGCAGWLVRILLMFSELIIQPILFFYWEYLLACVSSFKVYLTLLVFSLIVLITAIDYRFVFPFVRSILLL